MRNGNLPLSYCRIIIPSESPKELLEMHMEQKVGESTENIKLVTHTNRKINGREKRNRMVCEKVRMHWVRLARRSDLGV